MAERKVATIVGVGPGLGAAVARRFGREGFAVALIARGEGSLAPIHSEIVAAGGTALAVTADATDAASIASAFERVRHELGESEVLAYTAGHFQLGGILDVPPGDFERAWRTICLGAVLAVREVLPAMVARRRGTILLTGATASLRGSKNFASFAVGKLGLRALGQSLAREFGPQGIHVGHVIIDGAIDTPRLRNFMPDRPREELLAPDAIAEVYWQLYLQDPTAWTLELDVRPALERF